MNEKQHDILNGQSGADEDEYLRVQHPRTIAREPVAWSSID